MPRERGPLWAAGLLCRQCMDRVECHTRSFLHGLWAPREGLEGAHSDWVAPRIERDRLILVESLTEEEGSSLPFTIGP